MGQSFQQSNQFPMDKIKSFPTGFLIREAISLGYTLSEEKTNRNFCFMPTLKSPHHGFLKMTVHVVWNIALRE